MFRMHLWHCSYRDGIRGRFVFFRDFFNLPICFRAPLSKRDFQTFFTSGEAGWVMEPAVNEFVSRLRK